MSLSENVRAALKKKLESMNAAGLLQMFKNLKQEQKRRGRKKRKKR